MKRAQKAAAQAYLSLGLSLTSLHLPRVLIVAHVHHQLVTTAAKLNLTLFQGKARDAQVVPRRCQCHTPGNESMCMCAPAGTLVLQLYMIASNMDCSSEPKTRIDWLPGAIRCEKFRQHALHHYHLAKHVLLCWKSGDTNLCYRKGVGHGDNQTRQRHDTACNLRNKLACVIVRSKE